MDDLLASAKVFLTESIDNYFSYKKTTFAILHGMIAIELLLKERLRGISPNLVYENIDVNLELQPNKKRPNTIQLSLIPRRLKNLGISLKGHEIELIKDITEWRNDIAHYVPRHDGETAKNKLGQLYNFIFTFLKNELDIEFHKFLDKEHCKKFEGMINELDKAINIARKKAIDSGRVDDKRPCSICHLVKVVEIKDEESAYCHFCARDLFTAICSGCDEHFHQYTHLGGYDEKICHECVEQAGDLYIEHLIDLRRGR